MATPGRLTDALRSTIRKKLIDSDLPSLMNSVYEIEKLLLHYYPSLEVSINTIESPSPNCLTDIVTVSRKIKYYTELAGPLDSIRMTIDSKLFYKLYIFFKLYQVHKK